MNQTITTIPLSKLVRAKDVNARKTDRDSDIKALAASIVAHGLLQNITVRPLDGKAKKSESDYEVVAGGRRLAALKLLVKRKRITKDYAVPCTVLEDGQTGGALEVSLAENVMRTPLHPADQYEAFAKLNDEGLGADEIAARFGVTAQVVRQRLKLASVSPRLIAVYRQGEMTLEQLMAFTISDDHKAQERVWFDQPLHGQSSQEIRRSLTRHLVEGNDRRARLIGADAYESAGGTVIRDLFAQEGEGYFEDNQLLDQLVSEKLMAEAKKVKAEGWSWVETYIELDYMALSEFGRIPGEEVPLTKKQQARLDKLCEKHDKLVAELEDEPDEDALSELNRIADEIDRLSEVRVIWSKQEMARSGAIVSLDYQGNVTVTRGLEKREERKQSKAAARKESSKKSSKEGQNGGKQDGLSEALLEDLSAHRTAALQATLASKPDVALTALLYTLVVRTFFGWHYETCIDIQPSTAALGSYAEGIGESDAAVAMAERHTKWAEELPSQEELWNWLPGLDRKRKLDLLAYCTARTVNALRYRNRADQGDRLAQADLVAGAVTLDMSKWWRPTRASYLDRVNKQLIIDAVAEGVSRQAAENIATMKKGAMAARAEELLAGTSWLPEALRSLSNGDRQPKKANTRK